MKQLSFSILAMLCAILLLSGEIANGQQIKSSSHITQAIIYRTEDSSRLRLFSSGTLKFAPNEEVVESMPYIFIDPEKSFQTVLGIGGALTDASAETFYKLPKQKQHELIQAYYNKDKGIGYSLGRTHINSCDFSSSSYTYVNDNDEELKSFNIDVDKKFRIPFIKEVLAEAGADFTLFASPWSPPAWMKTNNDMLNGGKLKPAFNQSWANYFAKFIIAYQKENIPIWGVTVQNEPLAVQRWESCIYSAKEESDFVKSYLGPTLKKQGLADKKIVIWDHNRDFMYHRAKVALSDKGAAKYIWGVGYHWYGDNNFDNVKKLKEAYPETNLLFTEGCNPDFNPDRISDFALGEKYGEAMINDFNNGVVGWTDWNVLLDEKGGPNHVSNFCFAPIHGDTKTGRLIYTSAYYFIGHFSKFIRPGAKRIQSSSTEDHLLTTAFMNKDGKIAVVVMNTANKNLPVIVSVGDKSVKTTISGHSILTFDIK